MPKWAIIAAAAVAVLIIIIGVVRLIIPSGPPAGERFDVAITTNPAGAKVLIDGQLAQAPYRLPPGSHSIGARMPGYHPASKVIDIREDAPDTPVSVSLVLTPLDSAVTLVTELESGTVTLDEEPAGELEEGQFELSGLAPGRHTVKISGGRFGEATVEFEIREGAAPLILAPPKTRELNAVLVTSFLDQGQLSTSLPDAPASLDGRPLGNLTAEGLPLAGLSIGAHELVLGEGSKQRQMDIEIGEAPSLYLNLIGDRNVGHMYLVTKQPGATIFLDGKKHRRQTNSQGNFRLSNLAVRTYAVKIEKEGFEPEEKKIEIVKGRTNRWEKELVPLPPTPGSLTVAGGLAGAVVTINGRRAGTIRDDGTFSEPDLQAGRHRVEISKTGYRPKVVERELAAGDSIGLTAEYANLEMAEGTVVFQVEPPSASVLVEPRRTEIKVETKRHSTVPQQSKLPVGQYNLTFSAPGYESMPITLELVDRETKSVPIELELVKVKAPERPKPSGMERFPAEGWIEKDGWRTRRGGGFVLYDRDPAAGTITFTIRPPAGNILRRQPPVEWLCGYKDEKNYVLFRVDGKHFYRFVAQNGAPSQLAKIPHGLNSKKDSGIKIKLGPNSVVHTFTVDGQEKPLDSWTKSGVLTGKFGFHVPGNSELRIKGFRYVP
ncbi:MAG: PEGA domain-containing protein [bacterium]|nr:PEGA domain-containing protein [bacterium]